MKNLCKTLGLAVLLSSEAQAAEVDLSTVSINMEPVFLLGGLVIFALLGFMAYRKAVKLVNRS